ncbi:small hydrophobic protein [Wufeng Eothenomys melanogaster jeilongvirus 1]|uniref:Small hydrophobic protein n=1 Tax=Wufeng Eothenomys melanogaster jeilongvirus 1 TaxID=2928990 RepID=A0A8T9KP58_9MONO|nr:small hydrophobic protein [Wufeng Eothenomys melanogaster jeilongvirus 1]WPV62629.1 MAG: hypothetical protein [Wufeng rodent jeilongvirus 2]
MDYPIVECLNIILGFYLIRKIILLTGIIPLVLAIMERDTAIILFIIGFLLIFWLIMTVAWLVYITARYYSLRAEFYRKLNEILLECRGEEGVFQSAGCNSQLTPPPYRQTIV